jgi:peptidoglycan hydrolase-like protein with peptidoglycan-binding domain
VIASSGNYPLPKIGPSWYTPTLRRDLLKKVQTLFGLEPTGNYDKKLADVVSSFQQKFGLPVNGMVDNAMLEMIGISSSENDPGWPETQHGSQIG